MYVRYFDITLKSFCNNVSLYLYTSPVISHNSLYHYSGIILATIYFLLSVRLYYDYKEAFNLRKWHRIFLIALIKNVIRNIYCACTELMEVLSIEKEEVEIKLTHAGTLAKV